MKKYLVQHIIVSICVGIVFYCFGERYYPTLVNDMWSPIGIGLYFLVFSIVFLFFLTISNMIHFFKDKKNKIDIGNIRTSFLLGAGLSVCIFLFACLFEWIYELKKNVIYSPTSYIFLIDDSGSMKSNDPNFKRIEAINEIMKGKDSDFSYSIYVFTEKANNIKRMTDSTINEEYSFVSDGNTDIIQSLNDVLSDYSIDKSIAGQHPKILLLSDGVSFDYGRKNVIERCKQEGISISSIALGTDSRLLRQLADRTGGYYVRVNDISNLSEEMEVAINTTAQRTLLSYRYVNKKDGLYAFLRIIFLLILGLLWSVEKYVLSIATLDGKFSKVVLILSIVFCTIASIIFEFLSQNTYISIERIRLLFCVLWAFTPGYLLILGSTSLKDSSVVKKQIDSDSRKESMDEYKKINAENANVVNDYRSIGSKASFDDYSEFSSKNDIDDFFSDEGFLDDSSDIDDDLGF